MAQHEPAYFAFAEVNPSQQSATPVILTRDEAEARGFTPSSARHVQRARRPVRVGKLRAVHAPVVDSLPTAKVVIKGERKAIKLDTGAQFSVAGEEWTAYGEKQRTLLPVDYVEGFTGAGSRVLGV
ncbi:RNA-dependent DNA polymerase [Phytophthora cinnamomi]|uniref:RNA-dependent DNA polymerase n=1 Tax=Phytophthora cinnamomi TaxID=4785 RepID=UPI003559D8FC|nr:RNA-dependent DNA polymerase [Phytophthora cinnamomi]